MPYFVSLSVFSQLCEKLNYDPKNDFLIHTGDFIIRGPQSHEVLADFALRNVTGVRGNHDQKVVEWRGFIDWVKTQPGGKEWFEEMESLNLSSKEFDELIKKKNKKFRIPDGWEWGSDHWRIAR
jgi:predicted phosphodiesterase